MSERHELDITGSGVGCLTRSAFRKGVIPDEVNWVSVEIDSPQIDDPTKVRAEGSNPQELARLTFDGFDGCDRESVESVTIQWEADDTATDYISDGGSEVVAVGNGEGNSDEREYKELSPGTNHYKSLQAIWEANTPLTTDEISTRTSVSVNSASSTCRKLWERRLVERWQTDGVEHEYKYQISGFGIVEMQRIEKSK